MTKPTLLLIALAGLLAAGIAASWLPAHPALAAALGYTAAVATLAHGVGAPAARTVGASVLVIAATLAILLRALRHLIDVALWILTTSTQGALHTAKAFS
ncbi:hypothetical protein ACSLFT_28515 [Streptomyces sp. G6]|uniref:hypothetical protein n=1 Tax=Streptomyces sp. G6 TaxID=1178736 RepID=UPI003EDB5527